RAQERRIRFGAHRLLAVHRRRARRRAAHGPAARRIRMGRVDRQPGELRAARRHPDDDHLEGEAHRPRRALEKKKRQTGKGERGISDRTLTPTPAFPVPGSPFPVSRFSAALSDALSCTRRAPMKIPTNGLPLTERLNLQLVTALNESPVAKRALSYYLRTFGA